MKKVLLTLIGIVTMSTEAFAVCAYQDCGQVVAREQLIFQKKLQVKLDSADVRAGDVAQKYMEQEQALEEQNKVLKNLETLSAKNNILLREIALESEKAAALTTTSGKISAKTNESLQRTAEISAASLKTKAEDSQ
ncbi:MAG: hypothetical protein M1300_04200 [Epsilonproteobacteria bacterium]|nr:hypothetical protein [Campylobacterota bacterium]